MEVMDSADPYKYGQYIRKDLTAAQWYFGSRTTGFYLFGIDTLRERLADLPIEIDSVPDGGWAEPGKPAATFTIYGNENLWLGSFIENEVYHALWYESTVGTLLYKAKARLEHNGFSTFVVPQTRRCCATPEQALKAERVFGKVFFEIQPKLGGVADHSNILLNGEDEAFEHSHAVMIDTFDEMQALKKAEGKVILVDSGDTRTQMFKLYNTTKNGLVQLDSITIERWHALVDELSFLKDKDRITFSIGAEVFQNINRDTLGLTYKACARKFDEWEGVCKKTAGKETLCGFMKINE